MSRPKHTAGPWFAERRNWKGEPSEHKVYISGDRHEDEEGESATAVCIVEGNATSKEVTEANANLIAAAPAMAQRLEYARRLLLQQDYDGALREINLGLAGDYEL